MKIKNIEHLRAPKIVTKEYPTYDKLQTYDIKDNPFPYIYIDLTYKCNMNCHYCYMPVRTLPDLDLDYFKYVCENLPKLKHHKRRQNKIRWITRYLFRFLGGEPTMYKHFKEACQIAHENGHYVSIITNGIKFADKAYAQEIKDYGINALAPAISMNGGRYRDDWYAEIDNAHCAKIKFQALKNMIDVGFKRIAITAIVIRDFNEGIIKELYDISRLYPKQIKNIHYRTAGNVGRWNKKFGKPYTATELQEVVASIIPGADKPKKWILDGKTPAGVRGKPFNDKDFVCRGCCREYFVEKGLEISIVEFGTENAGKCWRRGHLNSDGTIQSYFDSMREFTTDTLGIEIEML